MDSLAVTPTLPNLETKLQATESSRWFPPSRLPFSQVTEETAKKYQVESGLGSAAH